MASSPATKALRILLYAVNGTGLGHLTRLSAIAGWLRRLLAARNERAEIFFLSCSEADWLLSAQGFPSFKLPSRKSLRAAGIADREAAELIRGFARQTLESFAPDCLVVDTFPSGTYDELLPALGREGLMRVFIYRKQRVEHAAKIPYEALLTHYDLLIVPHPARSFRLPFGRPEGLTVRWTGPVVLGERDELWRRERVRQALRLPKDKTVGLLAVGGGGDATTRSVHETVFEAARGRKSLHLVVTTGPLSRELPKPRPRTTWTGYHPLSRLFPGFDFAISSAGYNSVHEMLHFGLPAILFPRQRQADDQAERVRELDAAGAVLGLDELTVDAMDDALTRILKPRVRNRLAKAGRAIVPDNGARTAAEAILSQLDQTRRR